LKHRDHHCPLRLPVAANTRSLQIRRKKYLPCLSDCCDCGANVFDEQTARKELRDYQRRGPDKHILLLVQALEAEGAKGAALLDVGGGVGALQHELAARGIESVTDVDASAAYLATARAEAARRGYADRARYVHGDFTALAPSLDRADFVTLSRVVCCYRDADAMMDAAAGRAKRAVGLIYPRMTWWIRLTRSATNAWMRLRRQPILFYLHDPARIDGALRRHGFHRRMERDFWFWRVALYARGP
jgi:2-polyprenyl-3-methyl-5-hydroxy-6-metoxy-1,4-benzoquinol methylase